MGSNSKISIVVPNYNKGTLVKDCLESVKNQTFQDWELIFFDDNSTDKSLDHAKKIAQKDARFKVFLNQTKIKGANSCRNQGISSASAPYIVFLDSDDLMVKDCLEEKWQDLQAMNHQSILVHQTGLFYDQLHDSNLICNVENDEHHLDRFLARDLVWLISGPIWPKEVLKVLNGFNLNLKSHQEYDLHVRALIHGYEFDLLEKEPKVFYRQNVESESRKNSQSPEHLKARVEMTFNHLALLKEYGLANPKRNELIARYLLDICQMMRWHKNSLGKSALEYALTVWDQVFRESIISQRVYSTGRSYIKFKHQMLFNRVPLLQKKLDAIYKKLLEGYIHIPSKTFCKTKHTP